MAPQGKPAQGVSENTDLSIKGVRVIDVSD